MMKIKGFIQDQFKKRLDASGCVVIYDGEKHYRECAMALANDTCSVIDAGASIITAREQALTEWLKMAKPGKSKQQKQLVIYVPAPKLESDEDKRRDPFQIFALGGAAFPEGDGDSFQALCRRAKPDFAAQIEALFQAGVPDFETVDSVGAGKDWPRLRTLLGGESAAEILVAFLSPTEKQAAALDADASWQTEFRGFCVDVLGYTIKSKGQKWATLSSELWRFRQLAWTIAERALELMTKADDLRTELETAGKSLAATFDFYAERGFMLDTLHRSFEQSVADCYGSVDELDDLIEAARKKYQAFTETMQARFIGAVASEGWPASERVRNTQVFDRWVGPSLKERGKRIAFFLVDALRYELGIELENLLAKEGVCELRAVCAQLPTITPVGMAALMPEADGNLRLTRDGEKLVPTLKGKAVVVPKDRLDYVRSLYGDQCDMIHLDELLSINVAGKKKSKLSDTVRLLLVKTTDIDEIAEVNPAKARELMPRALKDIFAGIGKLRKLGLDDVVIATDHGFVLLPGQEVGDTAPKPTGDWLQVKDRCLLGSGSGNPACVVFSRQEVGIRGDFESYAVPRSFGTFSRRVPYFHEGLSLQECVLPVIAVRLKKEAGAMPASIEVQISYRAGKSNQVTTRLPLIDMSVFAGDIFDAGEIELRVEAWGKDPAPGQERIIGEPASSDHVHPATGLVRMKPGHAIKVPIRLEEGFNGAFEVRVYDPETRVAYGETLRLKTNMLE